MFQIIPSHADLRALVLSRLILIKIKFILYWNYAIFGNCQYTSNEESQNCNYLLTFHSLAFSFAYSLDWKLFAHELLF